MKKYFPALDGLRLLASLNIVLLHLDSSWLLTYARDWTIYPLIKAPLFSASIFFILAGFIYAVKFSDVSRIPPTWTFVKARFFRLYPLHVVCTLLMVIYVGYKTPFLTDIGGVVRTLLLHLSLLWAWAPAAGHSLNQPSWSLTSFFLCYAAAPVFARYLGRGHSLSRLWRLLGLILLPTVLWGFLFTAVDYSDARYLFFHIFPPMRLCEFLFGMVLAHIHLQGGLKGPRRGWASDLAILALLALLVGNLHFHRTPFPSVNWFSHHTVNTILYAVLLLLLAQANGWLGRLFSWTPIRILGKSSFYPYLWHMPLIGACYMLSEGLNLQVWTPNHWTGTVTLLVVLYGGSAWYSQRKAKRPQ